MSANQPRGVPECCLMPNGRIALFVGVGYRYVEPAVAEQFAREILRLVEQSGNPDGKVA